MIINAEQARDIANKADATFMNMQLIDIMNRIKRSAECGRKTLEVEIANSIRDALGFELEKLGFVVYVQHKPRDCDLKISWE